MASKVHQIRDYIYSFDARSGGPGRLQLWGDLGKVAEIGFIDETDPVPAPVIAADLNSATISFRRSALAGLIDLLRNQGPVSLKIDDKGTISIFGTYRLTDSLVVCSTCSPDLLAAKTKGILEAMRRLVNYLGADAPAEICPVTFHLDNDSYCGEYKNGMTGSFSQDPSGYGHVCLYDVEKKDRNQPFTVDNAQKIQDQMLVVHEAMHGWFIGRQHTYRIQEPFCKFTSFVISEPPPPIGPDYCSWFSSTPPDHSDVLMKYLCEMGMSVEYAAGILKQTAEKAATKGEALTDAEFADVVSRVMGKDAFPSFRQAGILP